MKLNLLPRKEFEIILNSEEVVPGKYSSWALKRFCDKKGYGLKKLQEAMTEDTISLDDCCVLVLCALEHKFREAGKSFTYNEFDLLKWVDDMGGFASEMWNELLAHAMSEEKKNQEPPLSGTSLSESATVQDLNQMSSGPVL